MTHQNRTEDRDEVLFAFHQACSCPTASQIIEWTDRYPQYAEDIRAHAAVAREWTDSDEEVLAEPDESLLASAYSRALNAIYKAETSPTSPPTRAAAATFQELLLARGMTVPQLAHAIGMKRGIVGDLVSGRMSGPIKNVFINAVKGVLDITREVFEAAHQRALAAPTLGPAKADHAPSIIVRTYEQIIRTSDQFTDEEKRHWLEEE